MSRMEREHRTNVYVGALQIIMDTCDFVYNILFFTVQMYVHIFVSLSVGLYLALLAWLCFPGLSVSHRDICEWLL